MVPRPHFRNLNRGRPAHWTRPRSKPRSTSVLSTSAEVRLGEYGQSPMTRFFFFSGTTFTCGRDAYSSEEVSRLPGEGLERSTSLHGTARVASFIIDCSPVWEDKYACMRVLPPSPGYLIVRNVIITHRHRRPPHRHRVS